MPASLVARCVVPPFGATTRNTRANPTFGRRPSRPNPRTFFRFSALAYHPPNSTAFGRTPRPRAVSRMPGFLEKICERAMVCELGLRGRTVLPQHEILVPYKDIRIPGQQLDLLVGTRVILELKAVDEILPIHEAQLLS